MGPVSSRDASERRDGDAAARSGAVPDTDGGETFVEDGAPSTEARLAALLATVPALLFSLDRSGVFTSCEGAALERLGLRPEDHVGRSASEVYGDHPRLLDAIRRALGGERVSATLEVKRAVFACHLFPVQNDSGEVTSVLCTAADVTDEHRIVQEKDLLQVQLEQAQRLESVGQLVGGVAHDFNNLLGVILNYASFVAEELPATSSARDDIQEIQRAAERAATLTRQLLLFSRRQEPHPEVLDLNAVVDGLGKLLARTVGEHIALGLHLAPGVAPVRADTGQMEQVIVNLAVNARDAMADGGTLSVATRNVELDEAYARSHAGMRPGPHVRLTVTDTGHGMDEAVRARALEPFYSTKAKDKGTGLGLATVQGIVAQAGGHLDLESWPGAGTTVIVHLPLANEPLKQRTLPIGGESAPGAGETVLLVEDEDAVRAAARRVLLGAGYRVLEARTGYDALALSDGTQRRIDLLLTDLVMPQMSGHELAQRLRRLRPGISMLYMSGYGNDATVRAAIAEGQAPFLEKPFDAARLRRSVRTALGGSEPSAPATTHSS